MVPLRRKTLHYVWHWLWNTGCGDIGNQGPHELDLLCWALGEPGFPRGVMSFGGRFAWHDSAQTPNTQFAVFDYGKIPVIFEVRDLADKRDATEAAHMKGIRVGVLITCEGGEFRGGRNGGWVYDKDDKRMQQFPGDGGGTHGQNFIDAVRSRKSEGLHAKLEHAHVSSALAHLANISYRLGRQARPEEVAEQVKSNANAADALQRFSAQLAANDVDLAKTPWTLGHWLAIDPANEAFSAGPDVDKANAMLTRPYRKPYVVPEQV